MNLPAVRNRTAHSVGWAIFLGISWTWCIGMFLPVLLVRDYGPWAWIIFAVPNVVGAAAMGWTISESGSRAIVETHRPAVTIFSLITIAFQMYFGIWMFGGDWPFLAGAMAVAILSAWGRFSRILAVVALIVSCLCGVALLRRLHPISDVFVSTPGAHLSPTDTLGLSAACLFGFAFCPYLDGTFHRARQRLNAHGAHIAFGLGFGFFFLTMIVATFLYAKPVLSAMSPTAVPFANWIWRIVRVHWMMQLGFTIGTHLLIDDQRVAGRVATLAGRFAIGILIAATAAGIALLSSAEQVYRGFLGFYGLFFPGYVWLCMIPGRGTVRPGRRNWVVYGAAMIVALPWMAMAFLAHRLIDGAVAVVVVLAFGMLVRRQGNASSLQQNSAPTS